MIKNTFDHIAIVLF